MPHAIGKIPIHVLEKGTRCPHCTQFAKIYERTINCAMARDLITFYNFGVRGAFHQLTTVLGGKHPGDFAKLVHWGLIEEKPQESTVTKTSGFWRITPAGEEFVRGELRVHSHVRLYDAKPLGLIGSLITIRDALGRKFNYEELMGRPRPVRMPVRTPVAS